MRAAMTQLNLSARAYHRILKLARMIADLAGSEDIHSVQVAKALTNWMSASNEYNTNYAYAIGLNGNVLNQGNSTPT